VIAVVAFAVQQTYRSPGGQADPPSTEAEPG
jgi:hypothetical protein